MIEILKPLREEIDQIDKELVKLLVAREDVVHRVAKIKEEHDIAVVLPERIEQVINLAVERATAQGGTDKYVREIYKSIIEFSCSLEIDLMAEKTVADKDQSNG